MSKHTPGPWKATKFGSIEYKDGILGEAYDFNPGFDAMEAEKLPHMANARLMAAAPELFEILDALLGFDSAVSYRARTRGYQLIKELKKANK